MLRGRDIFRSFFSCSSLLSMLSPDLVTFDNPDEWVTNIILQYGEYNLVDITIDQISWGMCDILQPAADTVEPVGQSRLQSHRQLHLTTLEWPRDSPVRQIASPVPEHFLSPEEVPMGPRMLMDGPYLLRSSTDMVLGCMTSPVTMHQIPLHSLAFRWTHMGLFSLKRHPELVLDLVPVAAVPYPEAHPGDLVSYHPETRLSVFVSSYPETCSSDFASSSSGADYISEIRCHALTASDPWHGDMYNHYTSFLQDLITRVDPGSLDSIGQFTSIANYTLGLLAQLGLEDSEMQASLLELQEKVNGCRAATAMARDEFDRSIEALRRHRESSSSMDSEIEGLTSRVKDLWRDIKGDKLVNPPTVKIALCLFGFLSTSSGLLFGSSVPCFPVLLLLIFWELVFWAAVPRFADWGLAVFPSRPVGFPMPCAVVSRELLLAETFLYIVAELWEELVFWAAVPRFADWGLAVFPSRPVGFPMPCAVVSRELLLAETFLYIVAELWEEVG
ncbi:hypothetical protein M5K25_027581 [Dendrobium thyrsiflorum]|uniref:Uncharacterized protein n=1 Tax=Dendrobium thyrsiflorum TaxID=117978 RepID=A0ABD0TU87_DENTH